MRLSLVSSGNCVASVLHTRRIEAAAQIDESSTQKVQHVEYCAGIPHSKIIGKNMIVIAIIES